MMYVQLIFTFLLSVFAFPGISFGGVSYTVSPLVIDIPVEARDIITKQITVTNTGDQPVTLYPSVNNISLREGGTIDTFLPPVESDRTASLASWIEISRLGVDLQPNSSKNIPITFRINPTPVVGVYHAFIGFGYGRNRDEAEQKVINGQAPGTVINVTIEDKKNVILKLSKFIVSRFVTSKENSAAVFTFTNPGDEVLVPEGEIIFFNSKGNEIGTVPVNSERLSIPPGGEHSFAATVPTEGMFGKYKAYLSVEYGTTLRASINDTSFFYVFPLRTVLMFFILILLLTVVSAWYFHKRYFDDDIDDSDRITVHVRSSRSDSKVHDLHVKKK